MIKRFMIGAIRFYQKYISPYKRHSHCIFIPTCSAYGIEAIEKYGPLKGGFLTLKGSSAAIPSTGTADMTLFLKKSRRKCTCLLLR